MLPLSLLKAAIDLPVLIELKNGETYNGKLANIDLWMNVSMKEVIRTSKEGDEFLSMPEVYVRGNTIKYVRVPDSVLDAMAEEKQAREASRNRGRGGRSRARGRGGGGDRDRDRDRDRGDRDRERDRDREYGGGGRGGGGRGRGGYGKNYGHKRYNNQRD